MTTDANNKIEMVRFLPKLSYSTDQLQKELEDLLKAYPLKRGRLNLTHRKNETYQPYDNLFQSYDYEAQKKRFDEEEFSEFAEELKSTVFYKIYDDIREFSPMPLGRARLLEIEPRQCLHLHRDTNMRYHIALKTNPESFLIFPPAECIHLPVDGRVYLANTTASHTAMNAGHSPRLHYVISTGQRNV
tara:strand:- start:124147 stop:124710 length:564 start_codon:yes stop_codon:yes gene_type:complete